MELNLANVAKAISKQENVAEEDVVVDFHNYNRAIDLAIEKFNFTEDEAIRYVANEWIFFADDNLKRLDLEEDEDEI